MLEGSYGGTHNGKRKTHVINWDTVTLGLENGGLGIRGMEEMNQAFMTKLGWMSLTDKERLGVKIC